LFLIVPNVIYILRHQLRTKKNKGVPEKRREGPRKGESTGQYNFEQFFPSVAAVEFTYWQVLAVSLPLTLNYLLVFLVTLSKGYLKCTKDAQFLLN